VDESLGVYVGWNSLKGSFCDRMPLLDLESGAGLVFSGEEYSDQRNMGVVAHPEEHRPGSKCHHLLQRYKQDCNFIQRLNGIFHGLIADRARGSVILFN